MIIFGNEFYDLALTHHLPLPQEAATSGAGLATHRAFNLRELNILKTANEERSI